MKKGVRLTLAVLMIFSVIGLGIIGCGKEPTPTPTPTPSPSTDLSKEPYFEWKLNMYGGDKPMFHDTLVWWRDEMEKRTEGHFKVEICWGRVLGSSKEVLQLTEAGVSELGYTTLSYYATEFPLGTILQVPFLLPADAYANSKVFEFALLHPEVQKEAAKHNCVVVYTNGIDPYMAMSKHKLNSVEDFKGRTVRASGVMGAMASDLGAVPVYFATDELYEAFQRGMLEIIFGAVGTSVATGITDDMAKVKYLLDYSLGGSSLGMMANRDAWASLPQWIKDIHFEVYEETHQRFADAMDKYLGEMFDDLKAQGVEIYPPTAELEEALFASGTISYDAWLAEAEARGKGAEAKQYLKEVIAYIEEVTGEPFRFYTFE